jgi:ribosomal protein S18 acetylase RimI-like enzyme
VAYLTHHKEGKKPRNDKMTLSIRKATEEDAPALSRICLLTADAGTSAEHLHDFPELPGLVYSVPYVKLPTTWAFVLVDDAKEEVVGYIVGSKDTRAYERYAAEHWWPIWAAKYPPSIATKEADVRYAKLLRNMQTASDAHIKFATAHLHINILDAYQGQGCGRRLVATAIEYLKGEDIEGEGVWLGLDPRNEKAKKFYEKVGFRNFEGADEYQMGIKFADFVG